jgi:hypothetical protein
MSTAHIQPETKERVDCRQASLGAASSPASDSTVLSLDAFVRSIGVRRAACAVPGRWRLDQLWPAFGADVHLGMEAWFQR